MALNRGESVRPAAIKAVFSLCLLIFFFVVSLGMDRVLALVGFPEEKTRHPSNYSIKIRNPEFVYELRTNSQGLRYRELPLRKPESQFRMLVLGDSFTEGFGVEMHEAYPAVLERLVNANDFDAAFINAGVSTFSVGGYRRLLFDLSLDYEQNGVLIGVYANDLVDVGGEETRRWEMLHRLWPRTYTVFEELYRYIRLSLDLRPPSRSLDFVLEEARKKGVSEERISTWLEFLKQETLVRFEDALLVAPDYYRRALIDPDYFVNAKDIRTESAEANWVRMVGELEAMVEYCRLNRLWVGLVYLPSYMQYDRDAVRFWQRAGLNIPDGWLTGETELAKRLSEWALAGKVPFLSLTATFQSAPKKSPYQYNWPADGHWNAAGHELAGSTIYQWLSETGVLARAKKPVQSAKNESAIH
jgi:lysophospholipase L1-like esterase